MRIHCSIALGALLGGPVAAADLNLTLEISRLQVAEYHRPYVAIWLEGEDQTFVGNLAVWYDLKLKDNEGTKWLKDMRQWWRKSGRELQMPVDGLSGATRAPGEHRLGLRSGDSPLDKLPPGNYQLVVEAAREVGGRELARLPFEWPPKATQTVEVRGRHELGAIALQLKP